MTQTSPSFSRVLDLIHKIIHNGLVVWVCAKRVSYFKNFWLTPARQWGKFVFLVKTHQK